MRLTRVSAAVGASLLLLTGCAPDQDPPALDLPPRPADAPGGVAIATDLRALDFEGREDRIQAEVLRGNVPDWLRRLEPVEITAEADGIERRLTFYAMPDYLAVGSDDDYLYVPLSPRTARRIADMAGGTLPTPRMVDAAWSAARVRLIPMRMQANEDMWTVRYFERHNRLVQAQRRQYGAPPGTFIAGSKVDVVRLVAPDSAGEDAAIYGWHQRSGVPIQPLHPIAEDREPHFSMGVRLVHRAALMDGHAVDLADLRGDPELAGILDR